MELLLPDSVLVMNILSCLWLMKYIGSFIRQELLRNNKNVTSTNNIPENENITLRS